MKINGEYHMNLWRFTKRWLDYRKYRGGL